LLYNASEVSVDFENDGMVIRRSRETRGEKILFANIGNTAIEQPTMFGIGLWQIMPVSGSPTAVRFDKSQAATVQKLDAHLRELVNAVPPEQRGVSQAPPTGREVIATTGLQIPGRHIDAIIEIVSAEAAMGINAIVDIANAFTDFFGGRGKSLQNEMRHARQTCVTELRQEAERLGADAVVA